MRFDIATLHDLMSAAVLMDDGDRLAFYLTETSGQKKAAPEIILRFTDQHGFDSVEPVVPKIFTDEILEYMERIYREQAYFAHEGIDTAMAQCEILRKLANCLALRSLTLKFQAIDA